MDLIQLDYVVICSFIIDTNKLYGWGDTEFNCIGDFKDTKKVNYMPSLMQREFFTDNSNTQNKI